MKIVAIKMDEFLFACKWFFIGWLVGYFYKPVYELLNNAWTEIKSIPEEWKNGKPK